MTVANVYVLHGIQTPSAFFSQVEEAGPTPAAQQMLAAPAGIPVPMFRGIRGLKPEVPFRTTQLNTLLGLCTIANCGGADLSAGNTDLYYRAVSNMGVRVADGTQSHKRLRMNKAYLHWRTLTARHQGEASADCRLVAMYDGSNAPMVPAGGVALAGTPATGQLFGLGPVTINGSALGDELEMSVDLAPTFYVAGGGSQPYDTFLAVKTINPVITIKRLDQSAWTVFGAVGGPLTGNGFVAYLRAMCADATGGVAYVADTTGAHIKISALAGMVCVEGSSGGGDSESSNTLKIYLRTATWGVDPLTIATGQTI
jgi:hypothetical protein